MCIGISLLLAATAGADELSEASDAAAEAKQDTVEGLERLSGPGASAEQRMNQAVAGSGSVLAQDPLAMLPFDRDKLEEKGQDWVKTSSGEWIRGTIEYMRDGDLRFDSKEMGTVKISWGDVAQIHSPKVHTYVFERPVSGFRDDFESVTGKATMIGPKIQITRAKTGAVETFERSKLLVVLEGTQREIDKWSAGAGFGATFQQGNTDSVDLNGSLYINREDGRTRWKNDYLGIFGTVNDRENTNNHRARSKFDYFLTRRFYLTPGWVDVFNDKFQNIQYRVRPAVGLGYELLKWKSLTWDVGGGLGYQVTGFKSVQPGEDQVSHNGTAILFTVLETDLTQYLELDFNYTLALAFPDFGQTNHHSQTDLSFDVWGPLDLTFSFIFDRTEDPPRNAAGVQPKSNDFRWILGFGVDI